MRTPIAKIKTYVLKHKIISFIVIVIALYGGYRAYGAMTSTSGEMTYTLGSVTNGTIVSSLSESGQLTASQQLNLTTQVSGQVIFVGARPGQQVKAGALIAEIDPKVAQKAVRDAQANLTSAELSLKKIQQPPTALSLTQAQNALTNAKTNSAANYTSTRNDVSSTFSDLPDIVTSLNAIITTNDSATAHSSYINAQTTLESSLSRFQTADLSDPEQLAKILTEAINTTQTISNVVTQSNTLNRLYAVAQQTQSSSASSQLTTLNSNMTKLNTHLSSLRADQSTLIADKNSEIEAEQSLAEVQNGADPIDLQTSELSVTKAKNALQDAQDTLANYFIRAPFDGTVGTVSVNKYDQASGAIATLITNQQYATLSVNEVDAAKINIGNKATLTFSAIPGLTLTGTVAERNPVGTVTQGVVNYEVRIALDAQNEQVKPGMTLTAKIITKTAQNALIVPSSAVKTQNGQSYVLAFSPSETNSDATSNKTASSTSTSQNKNITTKTAPQRISVTVGINDSTNTQILSGLSLGDEIVVRTSAVGATAPTPTATAGGAARGGFGGGGGGGILRGL